MYFCDELKSYLMMLGITSNVWIFNMYHWMIMWVIINNSSYDINVILTRDVVQIHNKFFVSVYSIFSLFTMAIVGLLWWMADFGMKKFQRGGN